MRRLQANLAYLANVADRNHKPGNVVPQFPAIMEPPTHEGASSEKGKESLREIYARLKELWPEYKGRPAAPNSAGGTGAAPMTAATAVAASGP